MIAETLNAYGSAQQTIFRQDRAQTVGASEVGKCAREVFYIKNEGDPIYGAPRDPEAVQRWGATLRGTIIENALWEPALRARFGDKLKFAGKQQRTLVSGFLSATPDGMLIDQPKDLLAGLGIADTEADCITTECKSADPRTNLDDPKPENVFQIHVQIGLIREMTPYRPVWGLLSYVDASFWDVVHEFPIRYDPEIFDEAKRRARDIMLARSAQDLKPEGAIAGGKDCSLCAFTQACGQAAAARVPVNNKPVVAEMADAIAALARDAKILRGAATQTLLDAKQREEEVRAMLVAAETRKLAHDGVHVSWTPLKSGEGDRLTIKILAPASAVEPSDVPPAIPADVTEAA